MAYFALLWKARTIERYRSDYENEKYDSLLLPANVNSRKALKYEWNFLKYRTRRTIFNWQKQLRPKCEKCACNCTLMSRCWNAFYRSVVCAALGAFLSYLLLLFLERQLCASFASSMVISCFMGMLLSVGITFSDRIRCLVLLLIPQLFSKIGRYTLTCYALVLILTGPAANTLRNLEVLSKTMACGQGQIAMETHKDSVDKPFVYMKDIIKQMFDNAKQIARTVKTTAESLQTLYISVFNVMESSLAWLNTVVDLCNNEFGTSRQRCGKVLNDTLRAWPKKIKGKGSGLNDISYLVEKVCWNVEPVDSFCHTVDYGGRQWAASVRGRLDDFADKFKSLLYVSVQVHHSYLFQPSESNADHNQCGAGIATEIRHRADPLLTWLCWCCCVTQLFLLLILFRAKHYQDMYESRPRFDNRYVTQQLRELDLKSLREGRQTVLPLNRREKAKYVTTTSFRLVNSEQVSMGRALVFMSITTVKLMIHMVADYSLYWMLITIRTHGMMQRGMPIPKADEMGAYVAGNGPVAGLLRTIIRSLKKPIMMGTSSPHMCLPNPRSPDFHRYMQIGVLIFLLWFVSLLEPYGLRLRQIIMGSFRPERAESRAQFLRSHLLKGRSCFLKHARRKLHRQYKYSEDEAITFKSWAEKNIPCLWVRSLLGVGPRAPYCLLCGTTSVENRSDTNLIRCKTPNCPGIYCASCYIDIGELCTICIQPADYGDESDISLVNGSSDTEDSTLDSESDVTESTNSTCNSNAKLHKGKLNKPIKMNRFNSKTATRQQKKSESIGLIDHEGTCHCDNKRRNSLSNLRKEFEEVMRKRVQKHKYTNTSTCCFRQAKADEEHDVLIRCEDVDVCSDSDISTGSNFDEYKQFDNKYHDKLVENGMTFDRFIKYDVNPVMIVRKRPKSHLKRRVRSKKNQSLHTRNRSTQIRSYVTSVLKSKSQRQILMTQSSPIVRYFKNIAARQRRSTNYMHITKSHNCNQSYGIRLGSYNVRWNCKFSTEVVESNGKMNGCKYPYECGSNQINNTKIQNGECFNEDCRNKICWFLNLRDKTERYFDRLISPGYNFKRIFVKEKVKVKKFKTVRGVKDMRRYTFLKYVTKFQSLVKRRNCSYRKIRDKKFVKDLYDRNCKSDADNKPTQSSECTKLCANTKFALNESLSKPRSRKRKPISITIRGKSAKVLKPKLQIIKEPKELHNDDKRYDTQERSTETQDRCRILSEQNSFNTRSKIDVSIEKINMMNEMLKKISRQIADCIRRFPNQIRDVGVNTSKPSRTNAQQQVDNISSRRLPTKKKKNAMTETAQEICSCATQYDEKIEDRFRIKTPNGNVREQKNEVDKEKEILCSCGTQYKMDSSCSSHCNVDIEKEIVCSCGTQYKVDSICSSHCNVDKGAFGCYIGSRDGCNCCRRNEELESEAVILTEAELQSSFLTSSYTNRTEAPDDLISSLAILRYVDEKPLRRRRNLNSNAYENKSLSTDQRGVRGSSTALTSDWWTPELSRMRKMTPVQINMEKGIGDKKLASFRR